MSTVTEFLRDLFGPTGRTGWTGWTGWTAMVTRGQLWDRARNRRGAGEGRCGVVLVARREALLREVADGIRRAGGGADGAQRTGATAGAIA